MPEHKWDLSKLSAGERSALRRNAGVMMQSAGADAIEGFYRALISGCSPYQEKAWFSAMCMQSLWRDEDHPMVFPIQDLLRKVYQNPESTESTRKKCTMFMDISWGDDGFLLGKICGLIRTMRAKDASVMPDFEALADDLSRWNNPDRYIQRKWLSVICRADNENKENEEEKKNVD